MGSIGLSQHTVLRNLDTIIAEEPERLYCVQPFSSSISDGWRDVKFVDLADAIQQMVLWIEGNVASSNEPSTLAYLGANDIRYAAFVFACMRLRHTALLLSPRNSEQASLHVLGATNCVKILYSPERRRQVNELREAEPSLWVWEVPGLWEIFRFSPPTITTPTNDPVSDTEDRVAVYIHSSGTTGLPKPVPMTNGYFQALKNTGRLPLPPNRESSLVAVAEQGKLFFTMSPFFHFMGLLNMVTPIFFRTPFVLSPDKPLTADLLSQVIAEKKPETAILPPSILEELSSSDLGMQCLQKFRMVAFGGAPLAPQVGDRIAEITHLQSVLGSSECGLFGTLKHQDNNDWRYLEWNPSHGLEMRDIGDSLYELVVPRGRSRDAHPVFHTYPQKQEYFTGDIFAQHPEKSGAWLYHGRLDDVIVLSNGEKFNPTSMEEIISSHPLVERAVILGQGRFQSSALIEPQWDIWNGQQDSLVEEIWPVIKTANESAPGHARLMKDRIGITSASKRFKLTPKGSIQRRSVLIDYADEIESLYASHAQGDVAQIGKEDSVSHIKAYITKVLVDILTVSSIDENADIFGLGLDSLQTLRLGQILQGALRSARPDIGAAAFNSQQLYSHSTISHLSGYVLNLLKGRDSPPATSMSESDSDREARLAELVSKYSDDLGKSHTVILTGSTGSLGSYLLYELLRDHSVSKIYCLNRSIDAASRQLQSLHEKGLATFDHFPRRLEFLQAQLGEERLGLDEAKYEVLLREVDTIIHNAWKVNFNHQVESFEKPHIEGVRRLVDFSIASEKTAHIHFISSISTIEGYNPEKGLSIPEIIFNDPSVALRQGYGESKHVSERICAGASARCGVPTSIHRVGQIGGPTTEKGMWNKQEWVPSLIATSKTIRQIPSSLGSVSVQWLPVDITAKVITDIVRTRRITQEDEPCAAFHLVNPRAANWQSLVPAITNHFDAEPVSLQQWIKTLDSVVNATEDDLKDKPALKILDFFKAIAMAEKPGPWTETLKTQEASKTLRQLKAIDAPLMENWMKQWRF
ncbi:hypothetical protein N7499_013320 [Penicillium canescens]|uniref:Carrier domain-containing protein n=1 Tax=Penicillium canescens TaxID=5083 RepID=A0AAD6I573_PENCN|nr:uncharacterized protein N7446_000029 [Penicillium canescens]KAJ6011704.1 hypothetical protein N7522_002059 [Penicillium canescens]KAJ6030904.1 hypothetical protein N7460_011170 [Penicillium canescens]KAJ6059374.1 hypothetical protein N7444_003013 [Penicillium canescens]KAJ6064640.1 hypothetical protein N7499_013320 [Penicillium canescens]KAJ6077093.1 hypothetical protein N7446_000029 [Penicillium canescens]